MKSFSIALFLVSASAFAQINLQPGQTIELRPYQRATVTCGGTPVVAGPACSIRKNSWYFEVRTGDSVIKNEDTVELALATVAKLKDAGLCSLDPYNAPTCTVTKDSWYYQVKIGADLVNNTDTLELGIALAAKLRAAGLCR